MKIIEGNTAPLFDTDDVLGNPINLDNYKGKKVYVSFLRNVDCVFCNLQIHQLINNKEKLDDANVQVIMFLQSNKEDILESTFKGENTFPFTVIADPDKKIYNQYGAESSFLKYLKFMFKMSDVIKGKKQGMKVTLNQRGEQFLMPADFIIGADGKVIKAHYGQDVGDHIPLHELLAN